MATQKAIIMAKQKVIINLENTQKIQNSNVASNLSVIENKIITCDINEEDSSEFIADKDAVGKRLDMFVLENMAELTRSRIKSLIESGEIKVNVDIKKSFYSL